MHISQKCQERIHKISQVAIAPVADCPGPSCLWHLRLHSIVTRCYLIATFLEPYKRVTKQRGREGAKEGQREAERQRERKTHAEKERGRASSSWLELASSSQPATAARASSSWLELV